MRHTTSYLVGLVLATVGAAQVDRDVDLAVVRVAAEQGAQDLEQVEANWRQRFDPAQSDRDASWEALFGYDPPGRAVQLAALHAFLYEREGQAADATAAAGYLLRMARYRAEVPPERVAERVEYRDGLPAVPSFFQLADYAEAWLRVREFAGHDAARRREIEAALAGSAEFVFVFPEWGPHNRAMLRAESLAFAAKALPAHPRAGAWLRLAEVIAADSLGAWEIEDAQIYHPIWLQALLRYGEAVGDASIATSLQMRYYLRYFAELLSPRGTVPDFGDAWWNGSLGRYYTCLEWGACVLQDPELAWAARRVYAAMPPFDRARPGIGRALLYAKLYTRLASRPEPRAPRPRSGAVLDDVIGKKVVFRTGLGDDDLYLLLNYRDEGDWGRMFRDHLRQTLAVEEEKMHHGHADENAIVLLMDRGSVLLHDAGYRDVAPSGPFGAYRGDLYHNRLVARRGKLAAGQNVLEFLRDSGAYHTVRTERIDFTRVCDVEYSRTRVVDAERGITWDRVVAFPGEPRLFVVFDVVRIDRPGYLTLSTLWAAQQVHARGAGFGVGSTASIRTEAQSAARHLLVAFPGAAPGTPGQFPLRRHTQGEQVLHETRSRWFDNGEVVTFTTVLWPVEPGVDAAAHTAQLRRLETRPAGRTVAIEIDHDGGRLLVGCKTDLTLGLRSAEIRPRYDPVLGRGHYGAAATDADFVVVRRGDSGVRWGATNMTHVHVGGEPVFEAKPFQVFQTTGRSDVVGVTKWRRWEG